MLIDVKIFNEQTYQDYDEYNKLWDVEFHRMIFLHHILSHKRQMAHIKNDLNNTKDIIAVRLPLMDEIFKNKIIKDLLLGNGVRYETNMVWYPKEIWIYNQVR